MARVPTPLTWKRRQFAALDVNWWTCIPEEVIGPDTQGMRNVYDRIKPRSSQPYPLKP